MLYLEHCIISINNSNFQIFSKKYFLHFVSFENNMENGTFAPQEQMFLKDKVFLQQGHLYIPAVMAQTTRYLRMMFKEYRDHTFFHALTFAGSRGSCLNTRLLGQVFKHRPRDPASVNAIKQTL